MKKILFSGLMILAMGWVLTGTSCFFDAARDNSNDPKADNFSGSDLFLFSTALVDGLRGKRAGLDTLCANRRSSNYPGLPSDNVHAFISVDNNDEIRDMPTKFGLPTYVPIKGPTDSVIADNWADVLDGSIDQTLQNAGIATTGWWSGSFSDGSIAPNNCLSWDSGTDTGRIGYVGMTDGNWINSNSNDNCGNVNSVVLCISWNE
jgi:hypothetical protein